MTGIVTFLSDFGVTDVFVGLCHAVIAAQSPRARVIDLTHGVPRQDVRTGAFRLADCVRHVRPPEAGGHTTLVHMAVVDPGVGTRRLPVVLRTGDPEAPVYLVGPDNGLLLPAATRLDGVTGAWEIEMAPDLPATFHGRDVFSPAAAVLAAGGRPDDLWDPLAPDALEVLEEPTAAVEDGTLRAVVRDIDVYGNLQLGATPGQLEDAGLADGGVLHVSTSDSFATLTPAATFADVGAHELGLITDSFGWLAVVAWGGDAAARLGSVRGETVTVRAADRGES